MFAALAWVALQGPAFHRVPIEELSFDPPGVLPHYGGSPPWERFDAGFAEHPWARLEGPGEVFLELDDPHWDNFDSNATFGTLHIRVEPAREVHGELFLPKVSGQGFLKLAFRVPASQGQASERDFRLGEAFHRFRLLRLGASGAAWHRHRLDLLRSELDGLGPPAFSTPGWIDSNDRVGLLELFSGSRALYENLQLERALPESPVEEATVALDTLEGLRVRELDWKTRLAPGETKLDSLAALVPGDQHGIFFPSFAAFTATLGELERFGADGLVWWEGRSADAATRARCEAQLGLELSALARSLGPLGIEGVALTGSDPYLRMGSDFALLFQAKAPPLVAAYFAARQAELAGERREERVGTLEVQAVVDSTRHVSSYLAQHGSVVILANSRVPLERLARVLAGAEPPLAASDEFRFFRQRYALGTEDESAFAVLPDAAIRRWCSPRWRIGDARRQRAAAWLTDLHAAHLDELVAEAPERALESDLAPPELGRLRLGPEGVHSATFGTLDFLVPIAELPLATVTEREATLYRAWREGFERAWSNFFDPVGVRLAVAEGHTEIDLSVVPLILGTEYSFLRSVTQGARLAAGSGDPHPEALIQLVLSLDPEWEELKSIGRTLGPAGSALGADPLSWLGSWFTLYLDDGPALDDLLAAEDFQEALETFLEDPSGIPLALAFSVRNPLKLALFLTSLRAFVDGTAPGLTQWTDRTVGEHRFVEIGSAGLAEGFRLYYATRPEMLILSLNEATLLRALERAQKASEAVVPAPWEGAQAHLGLRRRGFELLEALFGTPMLEEQREAAWRHLPILNEWRRRFPGRDPLELQERLFGERLTAPGGGGYEWNEAFGTMESSVFGHPGAPRGASRFPPALASVRALHSSLSFEADGLRIRARLEHE